MAAVDPPRMADLAAPPPAPAATDGYQEWLAAALGEMRRRAAATLALREAGRGAARPHEPVIDGAAVAAWLARN